MRKRIFLGLLVASLLITAVVAFAVWYLIFHPGQSLLNRVLILSLAGALVVGVLTACLGLAGIVVTLLWSKTPKFFRAPIRIALNVFFPVIMALSKVFKIDTDLVRSSFIEVNNQLVRALGLKLHSERILLLAPHCLQRTECPYKITVDINNCRRCGQCKVKELLELRDLYGIRMGVATGGTLARKYVKEYRPGAIVAIACQRDLTSGIQDSNPVPVLGVTNERPFGPCYNTSINMSRVEEAVKHFLPAEERKVCLEGAQRQGFGPDGIKGS